MPCTPARCGSLPAGCPPRAVHPLHAIQPHLHGVMGREHISDSGDLGSGLISALNDAGQITFISLSFLSYEMFCSQLRIAKHMLPESTKRSKDLLQRVVGK